MAEPLQFLLGYVHLHVFVVGIVFRVVDAHQLHIVLRSHLQLWFASDVLRYFVLESIPVHFVQRVNFLRVVRRLLPLEGQLESVVAGMLTRHTQESFLLLFGVFVFRVLALLIEGVCAETWQRFLPTDLSNAVLCACALTLRFQVLAVARSNAPPLFVEIRQVHVLVLTSELFSIEAL